MNPIINDLITYLESSPHKVATKAYVLNRLRESQRHDNGNCSPLEVSPLTMLKMDVENVWGGDQNRNIQENDRRSS